MADGGDAGEPEEPEEFTAGAIARADSGAEAYIAENVNTRPAQAKNESIARSDHEHDERTDTRRADAVQAPIEKAMCDLVNFLHQVDSEQAVRAGHGGWLLYAPNEAAFGKQRRYDGRTMITGSAIKNWEVVYRDAGFELRVFDDRRPGVFCTTGVVSPAQ